MGLSKLSDGRDSIARYTYGTKRFPHLVRDVGFHSHGNESENTAVGAFILRRVSRLERRFQHLTKFKQFPPIAGPISRFDLAARMHYYVCWLVEKATSL